MRRLAGLALILLLAVNLVAYNQARSMITVRSSGARTPAPEKLTGTAKLKTLLLGIRLPRATAYSTPREHGLEAETLPVASTDGIMLKAWLCPSEGSRVIVLMFHGYGSEKSAMLEEAKALYDLGLSVCLADFRGSGESSGDRTTIGYQEADDVQAVYAAVKARYPEQRIILYGESMGAAAILRAVAKGGVAPDGIIAVSVFDSLLRTVENRFESMRVPSFPAAHLLVFWAGILMHGNAFAYHPVRYAESVECPILFIHGAKDPRARLADARRVYEAVPGTNKRFAEFTDSGHQSHLNDNQPDWTEQVSWLLPMVSKESELN